MHGGYNLYSIHALSAHALYTAVAALLLEHGLRIEQTQCTMYSVQCSVYFSVAIIYCYCIHDELCALYTAVCTGFHGFDCILTGLIIYQPICSRYTSRAFNVIP